MFRGGRNTFYMHVIFRYGFMIIFGTFSTSYPAVRLFCHDGLALNIHLTNWILREKWRSLLGMGGGSRVGAGRRAAGQ